MSQKMPKKLQVSFEDEVCSSNSFFVPKCMMSKRHPLLVRCTTQLPWGNFLPQVSNSLEDFCKRVRAPHLGFCLDVGDSYYWCLKFSTSLEKIELLIEYHVLTSGPLELLWIVDRVSCTGIESGGGSLYNSIENMFWKMLIKRSVAKPKQQSHKAFSRSLKYGVIGWRYICNIISCVSVSMIS